MVLPFILVFQRTNHFHTAVKVITSNIAVGYDVEIVFNKESANELCVDRIGKNGRLLEAFIIVGIKEIGTVVFAKSRETKQILFGIDQTVFVVVKRFGISESVQDFLVEFGNVGGVTCVEKGKF